MTLLPDYFEYPFAAGASQDHPYPGYAALRTHDPVHWSERLQAWLVSRHADVLRILCDPRWSSNYLNSGVEAGLAPRSASPRVLLFMDGPEHLRLRRIVSHHVNALLPVIRAEAETSVSLLLDGFRECSDIEFASEFAAPLSTRILGTLLGVPHSDLTLVASTARKISPLIDWTRDVTALGQAQYEIAQFTPYLLNLLRHKRRRPGLDLISSLAGQARGRAIGYSDVIFVAILIMAAGHLTSVHMLSYGLLALLRQPHVIESLASAAYAPSHVVEEVLRFDAPVQATPRTALVDLDLAGTRIRRGETALALLGSANRDGSVVPNPDLVDPARQLRGTMSFGAGPHYCLGAGVARTIGEVAFGRLLTRYPRLRLAEQSLKWRPTLTQHGLTALRVRV
jgi:cytochrome P450